MKPIFLITATLVLVGMLAKPVIAADYKLICPKNADVPYSMGKKFSAKECWRRHRTACDDDGRMLNQFHHPVDVCNTRVCYCAADYTGRFQQWVDETQDYISNRGQAGFWHEDTPQKQDQAELGHPDASVRADESDAPTPKTQPHWLAGLSICVLAASFAWFEIAVPT